MKMERTGRQRVVGVAVAIATLLIVGQAISNLVAGSMGQTPTDKAWNYIVVLVLAMGFAGGLAALRSRFPSRRQRGVVIVSAITSAAIVGFYYAGEGTGRNPGWAIVGAVVAGLGTAIVSFYRWGVSTAIFWRLSTALSAYGFSFLIGATALACLNVGYLLPGIGLSALSLLYLWLTWQGLLETVQLIRQASNPAANTPA